MPFDTIKNWIKYKDDWESICTRCGKCCYTRSFDSNNQLIIHYDSPCKYLDTQTNLCTIYDERFKKCNYCGKVTLFTALYNPTLPSDCAYVQIFRLQKKSKERY
ncbi:MAG: hypothetical protein LIO62_03585 [Clostridiales bacterium]|nr:hypothetical protein [Clostridiales bacterium]